MEKQKKVFQELKERFIKKLVFTRFRQKMRIEVDTLDYATEEVLL